MLEPSSPDAIQLSCVPKFVSDAAVRDAFAAPVSLKIL
jgi:hypothetical protein